MIVNAILTLVLHPHNDLRANHILLSVLEHDQNAHLLSKQLLCRVPSSSCLLTQAMPNGSVSSAIVLAKNVCTLLHHSLVLSLTLSKLCPSKSTWLSFETPSSHLTPRTERSLRMTRVTRSRRKSELFGTSWPYLRTSVGCRWRGLHGLGRGGSPR